MFFAMSCSIDNIDNEVNLPWLIVDLFIISNLENDLSAVAVVTGEVNII